MTGTLQALDLESLLAEESFVRSLAKSLLFDEQQVDDVVQQTWLQALRRPPGSAESPRGWLASVVRSQASNLHRGESRRQRREQEVAQRLPSNEDLLAREARRREVVEAVVQLAEPYRSSILLRYFEGLPPRAIAAQLGIPRGTVATRLKRALQMLRERLDERHDGDRRRWAVGLVPLAIPPHGTAGMLVTKVASLLGVLWMMKHLYLLMAAAVAALLILGVVWLWNGDRPDPAWIETPAAAMASATLAPESADPVGAPEAAAVAPREVVAGEPALAPSVQRLLAGFRGRLLMPDGTPAADQGVRVLGIDSVMAFGGAADPFASRVPAVGPRSHDARTDADGRFFVEGVWPGLMCALHAGLGGPHPLLQVLNRTPGPEEIVDLGEITLAAKGAIAGVVTGPGGEPIRGAEIWATDLPGALLDLAPLDRLEPTGAVFLSLPAQAAQAEPTQPHAVGDPARYARKLRSHVALGIMRARDVEGWVVLELPEWGQRFREQWPIPRTMSGADGTFHLAGVEPSANVLVVRMPGLATGGRKRVLVKPGAVVDVGEIELDTGEVIDGVVADAAGQPVAGADIRTAPRPALGMTGALFSAQSWLSGADGHFTVTGMPRGGAVLAVRRGPGHPWAMAGDLEGGDEDLEILLDDSAGLDVVLRGADGEPIDGAELKLVQGPPIGELSLAGLTPPLAVERRLEWLGDGRARLSALVAGLYTLHVRAPGYTAVTTIVRADLAPTDPVELTLRREVACGVEVVDRRGSPVEGAKVYAQTKELPAWAHSVIYGNRSEGFQPWTRLSRTAGVTDASGRLIVTGLPAGPAHLTVHHPAFGAASSEVVLPSTHRFVLEDTGSIRGRLFDRGKPAAAVDWRLVARHKDGTLPSGMPWPVGQAVPDAEGSYVFSGLAPGRYDVRAVKSVADVSSFGAFFEKLKGTYSFSFDPLRSEEVVVVAGQAVTLDFDIDESRGLPGMATVRLTGRVAVDGAPAAGFELSRGDWFSESRLAATAADGSYVADGLKPQMLWLRVIDPRAPAVRLWMSQVFVRGDRDFELDIDLQLGTLRGRVIGADGVPAAGHSVRVRGSIEGTVSGAQIVTVIPGTNVNPLDHKTDPAGSAGPLRISRPACNATVETDAEGRFEVRVPRGKYSCDVTGPQGRSGVRGLEVGPSGVATCEINLVPDGVIAGHYVRQVDDPDSMWVMLERDVERASTWHMGTIEPDGSFHFASVVPGRYRIYVQGTGLARRAAVPSHVEVESGGKLDLGLR